MAQIKGIEIAIKADTHGVTESLKDISKESAKASKDLKTVNSLLKLDPKNTELVKQEQKLLKEAIKSTSEKLKDLEKAEKDVKKAFKKGDISRDEYIAFQGELSKTRTKLKELKDEADKSKISLEQLGNGLKTGLKVGAQAAGVAVAAVGAAVVGLGKQVVEGFGELEQNLGGSEAVFGEYAEQIQKVGEKAYKNLGVSQSDYLSAANKMGALLQGSGFSAAESVEITEKAMQRAADMASVMGIDTTAALEAVNGAAKGNFTMMDNLGVAINDTTLKAYAQEKGLGELATTQDKVSAAMQLFLEKTEQYDGNFANEATETVSGSIGLMGAAWDTLVAGLGQRNADIESLTDNVVDAFQSVVDNVLPVIENFVNALPKVISALTTTISKLMPKFVAIIVKNIPLIINSAKQIISSLATALVDNLPEIVSSAMEIIVTLAQGLIESLPVMIPSIIEIIMQIVQTLISNIGMLVDAAIEIIMALTDGIIDALPILIDQMPAVVEQLVDAIIKNAPKLIRAAGELVVKLVQGIVAMLPKVGDSALQIITTLVTSLRSFLSAVWNAGKDVIGKVLDALKTGLNDVWNFAIDFITKFVDGVCSWFSELWNLGKDIVSKVGDGIVALKDNARQWGSDLIQGLINGIKNKIQDIKDAAAQVAETIKSYLHFSVPDVGPLTDYETWMPDFMHGLAKGIENNKQIVANAMRSLADDMVISPRISGGMSASDVSTASGMASQNYSSNIVINLNATINNDMDIRSVAETLGRELQSITDGNSLRKGVFA